MKTETQEGCPMTKHETFAASKPPFKTRYGNFVNGEWADAKSGRTFDNVSPITGQKICEIARSDKDIMTVAEKQLKAEPALRDSKITVKSVEGHAVWIYWPLQSFGTLR